MANVITINDGQTHVIDTPVEANYVVSDGTLEVTTGGVLTGATDQAGVTATVEVVYRGALRVSGGTITSKLASRTFLGAVVLRGGSMTMSSGSIVANGYQQRSNPAILMAADTIASLTISGGQITGGTDTANGTPGIGMDPRQGTNQLQVDGGTITGGAGAGDGLQIMGGYVNGNPTGSNQAVISGGTVVPGQMGSFFLGSGISMEAEGSLTVSGGTIGNGGNAVKLRQERSQTKRPFSASILGGTINGAVELVVPRFHNGLTISGGTFSGEWSIESGVAIVRGRNLDITGPQPPPGSPGRTGILTGTLAAGQPIKVQVHHERQKGEIELQEV